MIIQKDLSKNIATLEDLLPLNKSYDFITRHFSFGGTNAFFVCINGLNDSELLQKAIQDMQSVENGEKLSLPEYLSQKISHVQCSLCKDMLQGIQQLLSGPSLLFLDGYEECIILDTRAYPTRSQLEPSSEKVTQGSREGFVESLVVNTSLIRRRIKHRDLVFEMKYVGGESKTCVTLSYLESLAATDLLEDLNHFFDNLNVTTLTLGSKSLQELLCPRSVLHPLPRIFSTERPDVACSYLAEGHILLVTDNSPTVLILPCNFFQFTQAPEDYYKSVPVGNYIRLVRFGCILLSLFALPVFQIFHQHGTFQQTFFYVLLTEFALKLFHYSTAHVPDSYSGSLGIIGGLLIGDTAVQMSFSCNEAIFYGAVTMLATLALASIELGEALQIYRMVLILLTGFFRVPGFILGCFLIFLSMITTTTFGKRSYFWPLFPPCASALKRVFFRTSIAHAQPIKPHRKKDVDSLHK